MKKIGVGVIGCGAMGLAMVRRVLALSSELEVVGIHDPDERSVQSALEAISGNPVVYSSYEELLQNPGVSWVMIASWNCYHREHTVAAFRAGKHVFCQKPLAISFEDCLEMHQAWRESGLLFNIGFTLRYSPHYRKIHQLIAEGAIGRLVSMEFNETLDFNHGGYIMGDWRRLQKNAGTHLLEKCCHDIDLANWMVGDRARWVASFGGLNFFKPENARHIERLGNSQEGKPAYRTWPGLLGDNPFESEKDIIDNQVAILEYANGVRASFHTNCNSAIPERRMVLLGTEGTIMADVVKGTIILRRIGFDSEIEDHSTSASGNHGDGDSCLAQELVDSMLHAALPSSGMKEGLESSITCFAIDFALEQRAVIDVAPYWERVDEIERTPKSFFSLVSSES